MATLTPIPYAKLGEYLTQTYTARELAELTGCTTQYAYALRNGSSAPSVAILRKLGYQIFYAPITRKGAK